MARKKTFQVQSWMKSITFSYKIPLGAQVFLHKGPQDKTPLRLQSPAGKVKVETKGLESIYLSFADDVDPTLIIGEVAGEY